jgi:hypothetical protein
MFVNLQLIYNAISFYQMLIETRHRADVSLAGGDLSTDPEDKQAKQRPLSAPGTKQENRHALVTAGETEDYVEKRRDSRPSTCRPRVQYREEEDML